MKKRFDHALITGGSRGLGRALAERLGAAGTAVSLVARDPGPLHEVASRIRDRGGRALPIAADVGDPAAAIAIAGRAVDAHGPVDLLVHAASTLGPVPLRPLVDLAGEEVADTFAVNLLGPFRLTRAVLPSMLLARRGTVLAISSDAAVEAYPTWGAYGSSKAALDHLIAIWAAELEGSGVRARSIDPGEMNTRMHADAMPEADVTPLADPADVAVWILEALQDPTLPLRSAAAAPVEKSA